MRPGWLLPRFLASLALGAAFVAVDHNTQVLGEARARLAAYVVAPISMVAQLPTTVADAGNDYLKTRERLIGEKHDLSERLVLIEGDLKRNAQISAENARLRALLGLEQVARRSATVAEVINTSSIPFVDRVQLDKGRFDGVRNGQGVFDTEGVVGQVTRTDARTSVVTLLTDPRIWVSARVLRTGQLAVVQGDPADSRRLKVHFVPADADLRAGDLLVTAGDGGVFPPGLPVGEIGLVRKQTGHAFLEASAAPTGRISQHRLLLVYKETPIQVPNQATFSAPREGRGNGLLRSLLERGGARP